MTTDAETTSGPTPARQSQKEATRQRVVNAARELFDTHGYQGTTIREIARHAGVAVGSVFTTFASKGEILSQVMQARIDPLYADKILKHGDGNQDRAPRSSDGTSCRTALCRGNIRCRDGSRIADAFQSEC